MKVLLIISIFMLINFIGYTLWVGKLANGSFRQFTTMYFESVEMPQMYMNKHYILLGTILYISIGIILPLWLFYIFD